jgi:hypothetical protein
MPTPPSSNVAPDFAHHDDDEVLCCPGAKWHHAPAVLVVYGEEPASPYQKLESCQQVFTISSPTAWGKEKFVQSGFHTCSTITKEPCVFSLHTTHLHRWRKEGNAFLDYILMVDESWMNSLDPQLKRQNAEWRAPMSPRKEIARYSQGALKAMRVTFFS